MKINWYGVFIIALIVGSGIVLGVCAYELFRMIADALSEYGIVYL